MPRLRRTPRLLLAAALAATTALTAALATTAPSQADTSSTLTVVGTSDVYDSYLVQTVLKPGFEAANPGVTLNYVSKGTGAAIAYAQAGTASAMIVHAAALENQFVAGGYSAEPYGRAVFWGDYVLLGPASDPAGVLTNAPHDVTTAFERIAAAGVQGTANFVSRGGTPGTTVQEHAIWALSNGVTTCTMSAANGGGTSPATAGGSCPSSIPYPSWYHATGLTQAPNILAGDACNFPGGGCYVFTDRGTFNYLQSTNQITSLKIATRDNSVTARGGQPLLVNSFHAYALNPAKFAGDPNVAINSSAATAFLDWMTSKAGQEAIGNYLNGTNDAPFLPSASPEITVDGTVPVKVKGGRSFTLKGSLTNVTPGTPVLNGVPVTVTAVPAIDPSAEPEVVAEGTTDTTGHFAIKVTPEQNALYSLAVDDITKIQDTSLSPVFGDILTGTDTELGTIKVAAKPKIAKVKVTKGGDLKLTVKLSPAVVDGKARLVVQGKAPGAKSWKKVGKGKVKAKPGKGKAKGSVVVTRKLAPGTWRFRVKYQNPKVVVAGTSKPTKATIP